MSLAETNHHLSQSSILMPLAEADQSFVPVIHLDALVEANQPHVPVMSRSSIRMPLAKANHS